MIYALVVLLVCCALVVRFAPHSEDWSILFFFTFLVGIFSLVGTWVVLAENSTQDYRTHSLAALQDGSGTQGSFFLGTGYIDDEQRFTYYQEDNGVYRLKSVRAEDARVVQDSGKPKVVTRCNVDGLANYFLPGIINTRYDCSYRLYEFHVPTGSIKSNYTLDAQ